MNRIRNIAAVVLGATLAMGVAATASAQSAGSNKEQAQEKFDRDKVTLKDRVQDAIGSAQANTDALKRLGDTDKGAIQKRDKDMEKKLGDMTDGLKKDLDKIDKATPADWSSVHATVTKDLNAMTQELKVATNITHVPTTGAALKQPESKPETPSPKPTPQKNP
jgi:hypothetical protein